MRALLIACLMTTACSNEAESPPDDTDLAAVDDTDAPPAPDGGALFAEHCAVCHNSDGTGTGVGPDITGELNRADATLVNLILNGTGRMPAQSVTEAEAQAIVTWMKATL